MHKPGTVTLVGAGPGDPGLLTLRGREAIAAADVVVYDRLVSEELLRHAREGVELIDAGKGPGDHTLTQEQINAVLVEQSLQGKQVCRLKGGDPFVFGRGGEEIQALVEHSIPFEVVPGVTSAIAAPAYAGIPVTHRGVAASVAVVTGHEAPGKAGAGVNWARLATAADTLALLMGVGNLEQIAAALTEHGRPATTPVAVVQQGTTSRQRTVTGTLETICDRAREAGIGAPAVIVVGEVVRLRASLRWFDTRPLFGLRTLVLRTREQAGDLSRLLAERGASPIEVPLIRVTEPDDFGALDAALARVEDFDWLIFTSVNGVRSVLRRLRDRRQDVRALKGPSVAAIGEKTAAALQQAGIRVQALPDECVAEALAERLAQEELRGKRALVARAQEAREVLIEALRDCGAEVVVAACYKTVPATENEAQVRQLIRDRQIDAVTLSSASMARGFAACLAGEDPGELLRDVLVACIGPVTAQTATDLGIRVDVQPQRYTLEAMVEALAQARLAAASDTKDA